MLCFIDLGGHERYLKTAVYGLTCMLPDVVLLCVSARAPPPRAAQPGSPGGWGSGDPEGPAGRAALLPRAAREHLAVALALDVPVAVVITQVLPGFDALWFRVFVIALMRPPLVAWRWSLPVAWQVAAGARRRICKISCLVTAPSCSAAVPWAQHCSRCSSVCYRASAIFFLCCCSMAGQ